MVDAKWSVLDTASSILVGVGDVVSVGLEVTSEHGYGKKNTPLVCSVHDSGFWNHSCDVMDLVAVIREP